MALFSEGVYRSNCSWGGIPLHTHLGFVQFMLDRHLSRSDPSALALIDAGDGSTLTCSSYIDALHRVASGLHQLGLTQGDVIMVMLPNSLHVPVLLNAAMLIGCIVTTMNPVSTAREISRQVQDCKPRSLVTSSAFMSKVDSLGVPLIVFGHQGESGNRITRFAELLAAAPDHVPDVRIRQADTAAILYSSGTTGLSKGVVLSHGNLIAAMVAVEAMKDEMVPDGDICLSLYPMFHVAGFVHMSCNSLRGNCTFVLLPKYSLQKLLEAIQKYRVSTLMTAPPALLDMLKPETLGFNLRSVKRCRTGAAPSSNDIIRTFLSRYRHIQHFYQGYAMTESTCIGASGFCPLGSSGRLLANTEAKVVHLETGKALSPNQRGEIWFRSPCIMQGYLNNPSATRESITLDGWYRTGDLGSFDENGFIYIVDRIKELIKCKGFQVAPAELESLLLSHSDVSDCAVVPLRDVRSGEVPVAFVVRVPGRRLSEADVIKWVSNEVAAYKKIHKVVFVPSIPKSPSGKILRRELSRIANSKL